MPYKFTLLAVLIMAVCANGQTTKPSTRPAESEMQWNRALWLGTYNRIGHKSSQWNDPVHRALANQVRTWTYDNPPSGDEADDIWHTSHRALSKGCDDPLLLYTASRNQAMYAVKDRAPGHLMMRAAEEIENGNYPAILKFYAFAHAAEFLGKTKTDGEREKHFYDLALAQIQPIAEDSSISRRRILDAFNVWGDTAKTVDGDRQIGWLKAESIFAKYSKDISLVYTLEGDFSCKWAWDARGNGYAGSVKPGAWDVFAQRLEIGHEAIDQAYRTDPDNYLAALVMMKIGLGEGFDQKTEELWYQRAIANNPNADSAMGQMEYFLEPKWYGNTDDMLAFARKCVASKDWAHRLPMAIVDAHLRLSRYESAQGEKNEPQPKYFREHPEAYKEIKPVYEEYLRRYPLSNFHRERFALIAAWSGDWAKAGALFDSLGKKYSTWNNAEEVKRAKAMVQHHTSSTEPTTMPANDAE